MPWHDPRPVDPRMPPVAYYEERSGRYGVGKSVTMSPSPGVRLVREDVAQARIGKLRAALEAIGSGRYEDDEVRAVAREAIEQDDAVPTTSQHADPGAGGDSPAGT